VKTMRLAIALSIFCALALPSLALTPVEVRQCNAMAETFDAKQAEILRLQEAQAELAAEAETLGEAWEMAEEQRLFSARHGAAADDSKAAYEAARNASNSAAMDLSSKVRMLQADVAQFNARCAAD
jgi:hypothetical protein